MFSEYNIYIRNKNGKFTNNLTAVESVDIIERINDPGSWTIRSKTKEQCPFSEGDGIVITRNGEAYYSGVAKELNEVYDAFTRLYTWTVKGVSDLDFLNRRVCYPDPSTGETTVDSHYADSGPMGEVIKRIIDRNLGINALPDRRDMMIAETVVVDVGMNVAVSLRFQTILKAIVPLLDAQGYIIRSVWDEERKKIVYKIYKGIDNSGIMIFSTALNSILSMEYDMKVPTGNYIISGGQGEMTDRAFAYAWDDNSIGQWGRIEYFHDMRSTEAGDLQADADTTLAGFAEENVGYSSEINSADYQTSYKKSWNIGDYVAVFVRGKKFVQRVMQVETKLSYGNETITPTIGTIKQGQLMSIFDNLRQLRSDVDQLQGIGN